ncbi:MAG: outer membrane beta-barrel protein [Pseudolabrys sp.]
MKRPTLRAFTVVACACVLTATGSAAGPIYKAPPAPIYAPPLITGGAIDSVKISLTSGASETNTPIGWTVGAGREYALAGGWSAKIDCLYTQFSSTTCTAATCGVDTDVSYKANLVRAGLNYKS